MGIVGRIMASGMLTVKEVESRRRKVGMHRVAPGLYLRVTSASSAYWMLRYSKSAGGEGGKVKTTEMSLGRYDDLTLAQAAAKAAELRSARREAGIDPLQTKHHKEEREVGIPTFEAVARDLIASKRAGWKSAKHAAQWSATLETYAYPVIGSRDVSTIDTAAVLDVLNPIWTTKHETATRVRQRIEAVLTAAKVRGLRSGENPAAWRGHLAALLPTISKKSRVRHHPAMRWQDLPRFMAELRRRDSMSARALELTILTACRTSGVLGAIWGEFDLDAANWTIPPERMKGGASIGSRFQTLPSPCCAPCPPRRRRLGVLDPARGRTALPVQYGDAGAAARHAPWPDGPRVPLLVSRLGRRGHPPSARDHRARAGASNQGSGRGRLSSG